MTMTTTSTTLPTSSTTEKDAFATSADWREAVRDVIKYRVDNGLCFSSGGVAAILRTHRMSDLRFSVPNLGGYVRDLFDGDNMGKYLVEDDNGDEVEESPLQVSRITVGQGRTPAGQMVFVYGPTQEDCDDFDFEVDITLPHGHTPRKTTPSTGGYPTSTSIAAAVNPTPGGAALQHPVTMTQKIRKTGSNEVLILDDCRAIVYRAVLDAWFHHSSKTIRAGGEVHIEFKDDGKAYIGVTSSADTSPYRLTAGTRPGRIHFSSPTSPFQPGDRFGIELTDDALVIDFTDAL